METTLKTQKFSSCSSLRCSSPTDSVFEFAEPPRQKRFSLRKRRRSSFCEDNISVQSLDVGAFNANGKKRRLSRVSSLASFISPVKQVKRFAFQRATPPVLSHHSSGSEAGERPRRSASTPTRATIKRSRQWLDKFSEEKQASLKEQFSYWELRRQEAIYELYKGEKYMVKDLELVRQAYQGSLQCLGILQLQESQRIFGPLHTLLPVHQDLQEKLKSIRSEDKTTPGVGKVLLQWVSRLEVYLDYCCHLVEAREILENRRARSKDLATFLDLCRQSVFSRRLDLWSFLDVPRSKLTKYPLLLKNILKHTREPHEDRDLLPQVIERVESVIKAVDESTGKAICRRALSHLLGLDPKSDSFLLDASSLVCQGELRNNRGTKLRGLLFDTGFALTRPVEKGFRLYKRPVPINHLRLIDSNKEPSLSNSFKLSFSASSGRSTFWFHVCDARSGEEFVLSAGDEHNHKEWLQKLRSLTQMPLKERNS